jgi:hypothetical protein
MGASNEETATDGATRAPLSLGAFGVEGGTCFAANTWQHGPSGREGLSDADGPGMLIMGHWGVHLLFADMCNQQDAIPIAGVTSMVSATIPATSLKRQAMVL